MYNRIGCGFCSICRLSIWISGVSLQLGFKVIHYILLLSVFLIGNMPLRGYAQTPSVPGSADPARLQEQLLVPPQPVQEERIVPPKAFSVDEEMPEAPAGFILEGVILQGVTVFEPDRFAAVIDEYTRRKTNLEVLQHLAARITKIYRDEGYFLSRVLIPQQEVMDGKVRLLVVEGRVGSVMINDPENLLSRDFFDVVDKTVYKIKALGVIHGPTLERYMLLLNDWSGLRIQNLLKASGTSEEPGVVDVVLEVSRKKSYSFTATYSNDGSRFVGPHQVNMVATKGNLFNSFDRLMLQNSFAIPPREVRFGALDYTTVLTEEGLSGSVSVSYAKSEPGLALRALEVEGDSIVLETGVSYPVIRSRGENLNVGASFAFRQSATEFLDEELIDDKTRALSIFGDYQTQDKWDGINFIEVRLSKGLDIWNATETGSPDLSRIEGRSDFFKTEVNMVRQQDLIEGFRLVNALRGQYAPHPLLSSEEFGYGGAGLGRAYDPSEITGDQGVSASAELLYTDLEILNEWDFQLVPFAFYDIGKVWNHDQNAKPQSGASAGFGTYYNYNQTLSGSFQVAYPLTRPVTTPIMNGEDGPRILFSLSVGF